jgi:SAM-dependent methyltransferase
MLGVFKRGGGDSDRSAADRTTRHSRGWGELSKFLASREGLRVLDFGPTLPANINYLTELGHSVYMANVVSDAAAPEWRKTGEAEGAGEFDVERFCAASLRFSERVFDVILLWDTANFLPPEVVTPFFQRMHDVLQPGGRLLAFFHPKKEGPDTVFSRYQLTPTDDLIVLRSGKFPILTTYQTRQVEQFFQGFEDVRFFLGKDNMREAYATR